MRMTHREFFDALRDFSPLRVISPAGPSLFEAICDFDAYGIAEGHLNAITENYHWHIALDRFAHVRSHDEVHARSGRRVLYFALREAATADPFLLIYLYRGKREDFDGPRLARFTLMHGTLGGGAEVSS
jgi:hypothetical protein